MRMNDNVENSDPALQCLQNLSFEIHDKRFRGFKHFFISLGKLHVTTQQEIKSNVQ